MILAFECCNKITKKYSYLTAIIVIAGHFSIYFLHQKVGGFSHFEAKFESRFMQAIHINKPMARPMVAISPKTTKKPTKKIKENIEEKSSISTKPEQALVTSNQIDSIDSMNNTKVHGLNLDVKEIAQNMKAEFIKNQNSAQKAETKYQKFNRVMLEKSFSSQNGIQIVKKNMYDGRPIYKVTTPYGTYCTRHYKAGEKLELTPPSFAVLCGNL